MSAVAPIAIEAPLEAAVDQATPQVFTIETLNSNPNPNTFDPLPKGIIPVDRKLTLDQSRWGGNARHWTQDRKFESLNEQFREKVGQVLSGLRARGFSASIMEGWRSEAQQHRNLKSKSSEVEFGYHNFRGHDGEPGALSADIIDSVMAFSPEAKSTGFWDAVGEEAKKTGLFWGGDWKSLKDFTHVQLHPSSKLQELIKSRYGAQK